MTETAEDTFNQFWKLYPRRMGKRAAQLKFRKACERADIFDIMKGLKEAVVRFKTTDPRFIPHPATWLHQDRWLDELEPAEMVSEAQMGAFFAAMTIRKDFPKETQWSKAELAAFEKYQAELDLTMPVEIRFIMNPDDGYLPANPTEEIVVKALEKILRGKHLTFDETRLMDFN